MIKQILALVAVFIFFVACSDGENDTNSTTKTAIEKTPTEKNLINAGFEDASDVVELAENTIAFTYDNNGNKNFTIYDNENHTVLAYVTSFLGDSLVAKEITDNTIVYTNGMTVTIVDYENPRIQLAATTLSLQIMTERLGETLQSFTYTPNKDGAFVVTRDSSGTKLSYYDLQEPQNPTFKYHIVNQSAKQVFIKNIRALENGRVSYEIIDYALPVPYNQYHTIIYNYLNHYKVSDILSSSENSSLTSRDIIQNQITKSGEIGLVEHFVFSRSKYGAIVVVSRKKGKSIYLYGMENPQNPVREYTIFDSTENQVITNITMLGGGMFQYTYYNKDALPRQYINVVYNYITKHEVSSSANINQAVRADPEEYVRNYYANDDDPFSKMQSFTYTSDNKSDAAVPVSYENHWEFYMYEVPYNHVNPYIWKVIEPVDPADEWTNIYDVRKIGAGRVSFIGTTKNTKTQTYVYYYMQERYDNASVAASMEELIRTKMQNDGGYVRDYIEYYSVNRTVITSKKPDEKWEISVYDTSDDSVAQWSNTIGYYNEITNLSKYSSTIIKFTADGIDMTYDVLSQTFLEK